jgi:hypothetical protein
MRFFALLLLAGSAQAALLSAGLKAGVPLTETFDFISSDPRTRFFSSTKRYLIGPTFELNLPAGLSVEFDALFRKFSYDRTDLIDVALGNYSASGNQWEFPLLLKYKFPGVLARPYIAAGPTLNHFSSITVVGSTLLGRTTPQELKKRAIAGAVVGAGIQVHAIVLKISPEIRYTRWGSDAFSDVRGLFSTNRNQAEFLIGITF